MSASAPAAVFFDLDGTLVDTAPDFHAGVNRLRAARGLAPLPYAPICAVVSEGARAVVTTGFPEADSAELDILRDAFLQDYATHLADHSALFPGLDAALQMLEASDIPWGVVTNKPSRYADPLMAALALDVHSVATICPDHLARSKPDPEGLLLAADRAGVDPARCIYVGDHVRDIEAGRRAGMRTVAVGWGYIQAGDDPAAWNADVLCATTDDFVAWLAAQLN